MAGRTEFVRLPSRWIQQGGLKAFAWKSGAGSENNATQIVALMILVLIAHDADQTTGVAQITYDHLVERSSSSREKVSAALKFLEQCKLIERKTHGRSSIRLTDFDPLKGWAKLPSKRLYQNDVVTAFRHVKLRVRTELDALKLYLLLIAFRDNESNVARISYLRITEYSGIAAKNITAAISFLNGQTLIYTERAPSGESDFGVSNKYRVVGIDPYRHRGTQGAPTGIQFDEIDQP